MSLDWFEFHPKPFITDTMRLSTEAKGAYLLLMLDYYETEAPAPDDDEILAAITGLPIETWRRHRRVIEPLFQVSGGLWHHATCAQVIEDAHIRIAKASAKGKEAAAKRWNGKARGNAKGNATGIASGMPPAMPAVSPEYTTGNAHAEADFGPSMPQAMPMAMPQAMPTASEMPRAYHGHSPEHATGNAPGMHLSHIPVVREGANAPSPANVLSIGSLIDPAFMPNGAACSLAGSEGVLDQIGPWLDDWKDRCIDAGTRSTDWQLAWGREYDRRMKERAKSRPKPRVAVSKRRMDQIPRDWSPNQRHHEIATERRLNINACVESFADYILTKRPDWKDADASFRNWLKSPHRTEFLNGQAQTTQRRAPAPRGSIVDAVAELDAEFARRGAGGAAAEDQSHGGAVVLSLPED